MNTKNLEILEEYKQRERCYEQALKKLEDCINNVLQSNTQMSLNFARIRVLLEIESVTARLEELRNLDYEIIFAFCCHVNFRDWAMRFKQLSQEIAISEDVDILREFHDSITKNEENIVFERFVNNIVHYNSMAEYCDYESLSDKFIPSFDSFKQTCDSGTIKNALVNRLMEFYMYLEEINGFISNPPLELINGLYLFFDKIAERDDKEYKSFLENNQDKENFLSLLKERLKILFNKEIRPYCEEEQVWRNLFDMEPSICLPSFDRISEFIWQNKDDKNNIKFAIKIIKLVRCWSSYKSLINAIAAKEKNEQQKTAFDDAVSNNKVDLFNEHKPLAVQSITSNCNLSFIVNQVIGDAVISKLSEYMKGKTKPKEILMPIRAAMEAGVINRPKWDEFCLVFGSDKVKSKASLTEYTDTRSNKYEGKSFDMMVEDFRKLLK